MYGLEEIIQMNDPFVKARAMRKRYWKLRVRAINRQDWVRAKRYDRDIVDLGRYIRGEIKVWPSRSNRAKKLYFPTEGRSFSQDRGNFAPSTARSRK